MKTTAERTAMRNTRCIHGEARNAPAEVGSASEQDSARCMEEMLGAFTPARKPRWPNLTVLRADFGAPFATAAGLSGRSPPASRPQLLRQMAAARGSRRA